MELNIEDFRSYCLALGDIEEKMPFGRFAARFDSLLVFYVLGHMFCMVDVDDFTYVNVKSTRGTIAELKAKYSGIGEPVNKAMRDWVSLPLDGEMPESEILALVKVAFGIVRDKYAASSVSKKRVAPSQ